MGYVQTAHETISLAVCGMGDILKIDGYVTINCTYKN